MWDKKTEHIIYNILYTRDLYIKDEKHIHMYTSWHVNVSVCNLYMSVHKIIHKAIYINIIIQSICDPFSKEDKILGRY